MTPEPLSRRSSLWRTTCRTLALLAVVLAVPLASAALTAGEQFRVSFVGAEGDAARDGTVPALAYNSQLNEYLVVWEADALLLDNKHEIFAQRLSGSGALLGERIRVSNTGSDGNQALDAGYPSVAYNNQTNEFLVVWYADGVGSSTETEVFAQRLSATGAEIGGDVRVSNTGVDGDGRSAAAPDIDYNGQDNEYLVVWEADALGANDENEIFAQRLSATGAEIGGDVRVSTVGADGDATRDAAFPAVAYGHRSNEYVVVWYADALATNDESEIFAQRLSATGAEIGGDVRVSTTGTDGDRRKAVAPDIAYSPLANQYLVAWDGDAKGAIGEIEIFAQRLSATGAEVGSDIRLSTTGKEGDAARDAFRPGITYNSRANEYLVAWVSDGLTTDEEFEVFAQRLSATGGGIAGDFRVSFTGADRDPGRDARELGLTYNSQLDEYLVAWDADASATDDEFEVFARRFPIAAIPSGPTDSTPGAAPGAAPGGGRVPGSRDTTPPRLTVRAARAQRALGRRRAVILRAGCNERCRITTQARVTIAKRRGKIGLLPVRRTVQANKRPLFRVRLPLRAAVRIRDGLVAGRRVSVVITVTARDDAGNRTVVRRTVRIRR